MKRLTLQLAQPLDSIPEALDSYGLSLSANGSELIYTYGSQREGSAVAALLEDLNRHGIRFQDIDTSQRSLEDIFVSLLHEESTT